MNNLGQRIDMKACIVGGNWNNGSNAGVLALNLNNNRTNSNNNVGGRDCIFKPETPMGETGDRGMRCPAISEINRGGFFSSSAENQVSSHSKRIGCLFETAFSMENLHAAFLDARKGKRKKSGTYQFEIRLGAELDTLHGELHSGSYGPKPYRRFEVFEPKRRVINAPHFRDLVVRRVYDAAHYQVPEVRHAIYRVIYEIFDSTFIDQSFACRKGGGTHKASAYTQREMRKYSGELYYLKLDIRKFFYRIDRSILRTLFERKIKDRRMVDIMCMFCEMDGDRGIPIGNLLSQIYALIYMNRVDHFIKRELKVRSYVRYVDDFVLIGLTLDEAKAHKEVIEEFVKRELRLELSHWTIEKIKRGINFVGYRTWKSVKFVRKHSLFTMKRAIRDKRINSIISLIGHAKGTGTVPYFKRLLEESGAINLIPQRSRECLNT